MTPLVTLLSLLVLGAQAQHGAEWTYSGKAQGQHPLLEGEAWSVRGDHVR